MKTREELGMAVREIWIKWAKQQPVIKESWLFTWENLSEPDKEVDRQIGEHIYNLAIEDAEEVPQDMRGEGENEAPCEGEAQPIKEFMEQRRSVFKL